MAKRRHYYYVLVMTNDGPKFVTSVDYTNKTVCWADTEKPLVFNNKAVVEDLAMGLSANMNVAFAVSNFYELETQPYMYKSGHFEWVWDNENKKKEVDEDDRK